MGFVSLIREFARPNTQAVMPEPQVKTVFSFKLSLPKIVLRSSTLLKVLSSEFIQKL